MLRDFLKKLSFGMLVLFVGMQTASAQSFQVEDPEPEVQTSGYDGGFFIQSQDQKFRLDINGMVIPRYQFSYDPQRASKEVSTFSIRWSEFSFSAKFFEKLSFSFAAGHGTGTADYASLSGGLALSYAHSDALNLSVGMVGLPLDMGGTVLTEKPITATQKDIVTAVTIARSGFGGPGGLGVMASGGKNKFSYVVSIVNGNQDDFGLNPDTKVSFGGQVGYDILGNARGGVSDYANSQTPQVSVNLGSLFESKKQDDSVDPPALINNVVQMSTGASLKYKGLGARSELYLKRMNVADPGGARGDLSGIKDDFGYYASIGYFVIPKKFEVGTTWAQIFKEGPANDSVQIGFGANWYLIKTNVKLQTGYYMKKAYDRLTGQQFKTDHKWDIQVVAKF